VNPGDWLVGDEDGVVVIPAARLDEAIETAKKILAAESRIARAIRDGRDLSEILRSDEVLRQKGMEIFVPQLRATPLHKGNTAGDGSRNNAGRKKR
jgi:hypothetical protein